MSRIRKSSSKKAKAVPNEYDRATPESEGLFPPYLSPIVQCKKSVLDRSRIEFYGALVLGIIIAVVPMTSVTRSVFLLFVLGPLVDIVWRSSFTHSVRRATKVGLTIVLVIAYFAVSAFLILREFQSVLTGLLAFFASERVVRSVCFLAGTIVAYGLIRLASMFKRYQETRQAHRIEEQRRFIDAQKGWLDYRLQSEASSKRMHHFVARLTNEIKRMAIIMRRADWFISHGSFLTKAQGASFIVALAYNTYSRRMERDLDEFAATADVFIDSTQGHLRRLKALTKDDLKVVAGIHEYFEAQLKDVRGLTNILERNPPSNALRGVSQELDAAISRQWAVWKTQINIMRRVQYHCSRMVKATEAKFNRALLKATGEMAASLQELVRVMQKWDVKNAPGES